MSYRIIKQDGTPAKKTGRPLKNEDDKSVQTTIYVDGEYMDTKAIRGDIKRARILIYGFLSTLR